MDRPLRNFDHKKSRIGLKSEWKVFFWCILVATFLWFLTVLNEFYTGNIDVKVHYYNRPENKIFVHKLPDKFRIAVNAKGWDLLSYKLTGKVEDIFVDLDDYKNQPYILTRRLKVNVQQQLSQKISINDIFPDTVSLVLAKKMIKRVPVSLDLKLSFANNYNLGGEITYSPDSVTVSGPENSIKPIKEIHTHEVVLSDLKQPHEFKVSLKNPSHSTIEFDTSQIKVVLPVYQLTEGMVEIPIEVVNAKINGVSLIPSKVNITYQTTLNNYQSIDIKAFQAIIDGKSIDSVKPQPLKVQIISQPKFTYNLRLTPEYVNFVIHQ